MSKHTRAPWKREGDRISAPCEEHLGEHGVTVATVSPAWKTPAEQDANARLIAAAPELAAALEALLSTVVDEHDADANDPGAAPCGGPELCAVCRAGQVLGRLS